MTEASSRESKPKIEYLPPEREGIDRYARELCEGLADHHSDPSFRERDVIDGLAEFLHMAGKIQAKHFNSRDSFDKSDDAG